MYPLDMIKTEIVSLGDLKLLWLLHLVRAICEGMILQIPLEHESIAIDHRDFARSRTVCQSRYIRVEGWQSRFL